MPAQWPWQSLESQFFHLYNKGSIDVTMMIMSFHMCTCFAKILTHLKCYYERKNSHMLAILNMWVIKLALIRERFGASLETQQYRIHLPMLETQVQSLGQEDHLEKKMASRSSIIAWAFCLGSHLFFLLVVSLCGYSNTFDVITVSCAQGSGPLSGIPTCPPYIQLRQFPLRVSQAAQIQHLSNSLFESSNFPSNKTDLSSKSSIWGLILDIPLFLTCPSFPVNYQVFFISFSPLNISQFNSVSSLHSHSCYHTSSSLFALIMFTRSSNYNSRLPHSCPAFSPEDYSKTQIWFSYPSFSLSMEVTCFEQTCLFASGLDMKSVTHSWEVFFKNIKMDPT